MAITWAQIFGLFIESYGVWLWSAFTAGMSYLITPRHSDMLIMFGVLEIIGYLLFTNILMFALGLLCIIVGFAAKQGGF